MSDSGQSGILSTLPRAPNEGVVPAAFESLKGSERFETGELIGKGGMGEVFGCTDVKLKRPMALKQATSRSAVDLERFVREARVQGQLEHPSIVPVHELGLGPDGLPYFTMKRVRGVTLSDVIAGLEQGDPTAREKHSRRRLLTAFQSVCQAVEFAHTQSVLHRDLKPANVMLGDFGEVYVLDWGLAKPMGQVESLPEVPMLMFDQTVGATPTVAGSLLGTPGYMSPELVLGKPASVQSDVFALGSILFELLTLQRMVPGDTVVQILTATRDGFDARARARAPKLEIPPELEAVVLKACAKDAGRRYESVRQLHDAVERVLAGERDDELRRELAKTHVANAEAALAEMRVKGDPTGALRKTANQEVGRGLALDGKNGAAFKVMLELLQTPHLEQPPEVAKILRRSELQSIRRASFLAAIAMALMVLYTPWFLLMGLKNLPGMVALNVVMVAAAISSMMLYKLTNPRPEKAIFSIVAFMLVGGALNTFILPFVVASPLITVATLAYVSVVSRPLKAFTVVMAALALMAPFIASWAGLTDPPFVVSSAGLMLPSRWVTFDPRWTTWLILDATVVTVALGALFMHQMSATLSRSQEHVATQAYNLSQLLPPEAGLAALLKDTAADPECVVRNLLENSRFRRVHAASVAR